MAIPIILDEYDHRDEFAFYPNQADITYLPDKPVVWSKTIISMTTDSSFIQNHGIIGRTP